MVCGISYWPWQQCIWQVKLTGNIAHNMCNRTLISGNGFGKA